MAKQDPDEVERRLKREAEDEALARKLNDDPDFAKDFDESFMRNFKGFEDELLAEIADDKNMSKSEREAMLRAAERARKAAQGGFLWNPDPAEAEKIIMSNRGLREAKKRKKKKDSGWCAVIAVLLLGLFGGGATMTIWGAAELIAAVAR